MDPLVITFPDLLALVSHFGHTSICPRPRPRPRPQPDVGVIISLTSGVGAAPPLPPWPPGGQGWEACGGAAPGGEVGWGGGGGGWGGAWEVGGEGGERWGTRRCSAALTPRPRGVVEHSQVACRGGGPLERRARAGVRRASVCQGRGEERRFEDKSLRSSGAC